VTAEERIRELLAEMHDWLDGSRSWVNLGSNEPYTPDVIAAMDAAEVDKRASAIRGYAALVGLGLGFDAEAVLLPPGAVDGPMHCKNCGKTMAEHDVFAQCFALGDLSAIAVGVGEEPKETQ